MATFRFLPGLANGTLTVDARIFGDSEMRYIALGCRQQALDVDSKYRFVVVPATGQAALLRDDAGQPTALVGFSPVEGIRLGNQSNRLSLRCFGSTLTGSVNGVVVAAAEDATYREGLLLLGVGAGVGKNLQAEARFDNLVVTDN